MTTAVEKRKLRERLLAARKAKGRSQEQLSEELGCSQILVSDWETGVRWPTYVRAMAIERVLGITVEEWGYDRATGLRADQRKKGAA